MRLMLLISILFSQLFSFDIDIESLKTEAQNDPENINVRVMLAQDYIKHGDFDKAKVPLNQILAIDKNHKKANILMIKVRKNLNEQVKNNQNNIFERADNLEKIYKKTHSFEDFKSYFFELEGLGYKERGFKKLEKFVKNNPHDEDAVLFLANRYYWAAKPHKSFEVLKPVVDTTSNIKLLTLNATMLFEAAKFNQALTQYEKIANLGGDTKEIKEKIKSLQIEKPEDTAKLTIKKSKIDHKFIAEKYFFKKEYRKAINHYKKYFRQPSKDNSARFHYATSLEKLKLYKKAEREYKRVSNKKDKLYELSTYRYAKILMAQKDEYKWDKARDVLEELLLYIVNEKSTKERETILRYTKQSLEIASNPMPKPTKYKDIMLTAQQSKILDSKVFSPSTIENHDVTSIKRMLNPNISSMQNQSEIQATLFGFNVQDNSISNRAFGVKISKSGLSLEAKRSTFKNDDSNKSKKLDANSFRATYTNGDNFSASVGVNSFKDSTDYVGKIEYKKPYKNHNITYTLEYQNGIFVNGNTCLANNDINVVSLSMYDSILLKNLKEAETSLILNSFSDGNLNLNSWTNYPLYRGINSSLESTFSFVGSYEYNSKEDTCYGSTKFYDNSQLELKSKYQFSGGGFLEAYGSIGYTFKNTETVYSYGAVLQIITSNSMDIYIDCKHYQSGYSPDGADECYASISHIW